MIIIDENGNYSQNKYTKQITGEKIPGDLDGWEYYGTDPNAVVTMSYGELSARSMTLYHTHGPISAAANKTCTYAVGLGLRFRSQPDWQTLGVTKEFAKDWSMKFQRLIHYYFLLLNYYEKQSLIFRTADIMGDSLLLFDRKGAEDGTPFDLIETGGDQIDWKSTFKKTDKQATLGIIHDDFLRKKGIILDNAKKDNVSFRDENGDQNVVQFFQKKIARQLRGMSLAYKIIALAKNNDRLWDATIQRAVMETVLLGYKKGGNPDLNSQIDELTKEQTKTESGDFDTATGLKTEATPKQMVGGAIFSFGSNEDLQFTDLKTPSNNFDKMQTAYIEMIGMAMDIPPEVLVSKYSTSFTAHKGALNDFVRFYMEKRGNLVKNCNNITLNEIAKHIFLSGMMKPLNPAFFTDPIIRLATLAGNWLGPTPGHINPKQEVEAKILEVENAFKTRSDGAAEYGNEFDDHIEEWGANEKEFFEKSPAVQAEIVRKQEEDLNNADDNANSNNDNDDNSNGEDD